MQAFDLCSLQQQKDCEWSLLSWQRMVFWNLWTPISSWLVICTIGELLCLYHSWLISVGCILWPCTSFLTKQMLIAKVSLSLWLLMPPFAYRTARPVKVFLIKTEHFQYMVNNKLKLSQWWGLDSNTTGDRDGLEVGECFRTL